MSLVLLDSLKTIFLLEEFEAATETKNTLYFSGYWISLKSYLMLFTWKGLPQPEVYKLLPQVNYDCTVTTVNAIS